MRDSGNDGDLVLRSDTMRSAEAMRKRTREFAVRVVSLCFSLLKTEEGRILARQVLRSGTSVAANYRSACRARSRAEFASRIAVAVEEADETVFWLELLIEAKVVPPHRLEHLLKEANELLAILSASRTTAKKAIPESINPSIGYAPATVTPG